MPVPSTRLMRIRLFRSEKGGDWFGDGDEIFPITGYVKISGGIGRCLTKISPGSRVFQRRTRREAEAADGIFEICKRGCRRRVPANCRAAVRERVCNRAAEQAAFLQYILTNADGAV